MKAFLAEYASLAGDPAVAAEGAAMRDVLTTSFEAIGYEVVMPASADLDAEIRRLAPGCEVGLVIAPDRLLAGFTRTLEGVCHNVGCGAMNVAVAANKRRSSAILAQHEIPVPAERAEGRRVVKPIRGCGALGVRLSDEAAGEDEFGQEYIEGEHLSVSLVGSRVVGDVCEYWSGDRPLVLALNRQTIELDGEGRFHYRGGETPVDHPRRDECAEVARKAVEVLGCQGYAGVDIVLADRPYVVDVNPRVTTSIVGIASVMKEEIADVLVRASMGKGPTEVHLSGRVRYGIDGTVTRL
ncbi:MAG: ATP-grasp domain-containing protein [Methanospirillum sp.]